MPCAGRACRRRTSPHHPQLVRPRPPPVQQAYHRPQRSRRLPSRRSRRLHRRFRPLHHWLRRGSQKLRQRQLRRRSKSRHLRPMNSSSLPYISLLVLSCGQNHRLSSNLCPYVSFCRFSVNLMARTTVCVAALRSTPLRISRIDLCIGEPTHEMEVHLEIHCSVPCAGVVCSGRLCC